MSSSSKQVQFNLESLQLKEKKDKNKHRYSNSTIHYTNTCADTMENHLEHNENNDRLQFNTMSISDHNKIMTGLRKDAYGNSIKKGNKNYKVSFIDNFGPKSIADVIEIDLNKTISPRKNTTGKKENYNINDDKTNTTCVCSSVCSIF